MKLVYIKQNEDIFEGDVLDVWNVKIVFLMIIFKKLNF